ncbi:MAG TPA: N-acetyl-gamma-glutamyl-phosphate reductase [Chlorobaculum sp.]|jgi:N-acetyl-gamma-glutamyl-phosphate reductase|uniref:N-acetyl-gamma-glutamyl-phosphate reductase n=1 Tax=Chlorobaculum tepidum (strain ATCC 49652 / DSM 12025 / NBRC 103806 / TLS) TaxID=194439 RepID=ARGC_CHLTE|nr:N-acetyl-gamma-glutamyl-phosphate reductase [Chlorobaculum tepidum]Q8KDE3.1 RecName: Full=N-acetyl-gamma-glutamyl-phosphate reductase; Short=AGPR; AltName: Full=N-acetyl-glutamate semialdehyde dehydrogenase; Short=NAGSA dehydrogenase [Chlorobaculum tepidum TLS]AAM72342.1 N-acetyl-gamma-glutamyl-phosphate reductase [Chlorobaculum tepidum TLS]HBU22703.1 N-acetyl-gamma-glutamyl-phosphate reductase [Chlorobaculum sp.]
MNHIPMQNKKVTVSVIGASGYSGAELVKLLMKHPGIVIEELYAHTQAGKRFTELYPSIPCDKTFQTYAGQTNSDVYLLALPHGEALQLVPGIVAAGKKVIDLSGDFRLKNTAEHKRFYGGDKSAEDVLQYGMPELFRDEIAGSTAISNPGCYATSIILGLAPLFLGGMAGLDVESVNVTAVSGISGAGRSAKLELSFSEMSGNMRAYKVGKHQHTPEIMQTLGTSVTDPSFRFVFTPMIAPYVRGIYSVLNVRLASPVAMEPVRELYAGFYANAPFVRLRDGVTEVSHVAYTNFCDISLAFESDGSLVIITAIDNLVKGAAGQAVQNMNLMLGFGETTALL